MMRKGGILALSLLSLLLPPFPSPSFSTDLPPEIREALKDAGGLISPKDITELKERGVSDDVILRMLDRAERERARYSGITHVRKRADGQEVIVYGSPDEPPWPDTGYYYVGPKGEVYVFRDVPRGEEREAWDLLRDLHLEINLQEEWR